MTTIVIFKSNNSYKGFSCIGHAGYSHSGKDIVCASISVLVINTLNAIEKLAAENAEVQMDDGIIECIFPNELNDKAKLLMDAMVMGLEDIEKGYGKQEKKGFFRKEKNYFKLIIKEV
ncbi:MAG: ribosomal-processing cysteine protease Prp [Lachnospiraceae bacterium]|nr:ribosomal-processing cysteine protease Prp [Lachnospiraceae bacterium]